MFEKLVSDVLLKYLGDYVENLNPNDLNIGIWGGDVNLENVALKKTALDALDLPVSIAIGNIGSITMKIPWKRLKDDPVVVNIDNVFLLVEPRNAFNYDAAAVAKARKAAKQAKLDAYEQLKKEKARLAQGKDEDAAGYMGQLVTKIVDNLQVTVNRIHIRYEDTFSNPSSPVSLGVTLREVVAVSTDENFTPKFLNDPLASLVHKLVRIGSLSVYYDHSSRLLTKMKRSEAIQAMYRDIPTEEAKGEHQFLIHPFTQELRAILNKKKGDTSRPSQEIELHLSDLDIGCTKSQYQSLMKTLETISMLSLRIAHMSERPKVPVKGNARQWWRYAIQVHLKDIRSKNANSIANTLISRGIDRRRYVALYKRTTGVEWVAKLNEQEKKELQALEDKHEANDIIFFRSTADAQLEAEGKEYWKTHTKNTGWFGGWFKTTPAKKEESLLTQEQINAIYDVIDYHGAVDTNPFPKDFVQTKVHVSIGRQALTLRNDQLAQPNEIVAAITGGSVVLELMPKGPRVSVNLDDFVVQDSVLKESEFPYIVSRSVSLMDTEEDESFFDALEELSESSVKSPETTRRTVGSTASAGRSNQPPVLSLTFEQAPSHVEASAFVELRVMPQEVAITMPTINRLVDVFAMPTEVNLEQLSDATASSLYAYTTMGTRQFQEALRDHKTLALDIDIRAPIVIVPQDPFTRETVILGADLGRLTVTTELQADVATHRSASGILGVDPPSWLDEHDDVYDRYHLAMSDVAVFVTRNNASWRVPEIRNVQGLHLVENFDIRLIVCNSITPLETRYPRVKVAGATTPVKINFGAEKYVDVMSVVATLTPPTPPEAEAAPAEARAQRVPSTSSRLAAIPSSSLARGSDAVVVHSSLAASDEPDMTSSPLDIKDKSNKAALAKWIQTYAFFSLPSLSVTVTAPDSQGSPGATKRLVVVSMEDLSVTYKQRYFDQSARVTLAALMVEDCLQSHGGMSQYLLSSHFIEEDEASSGKNKDTKLIQLDWHAVDPKSPDFNKTLQSVNIKFGYLGVVINQRSLATLIDFGNSVLKETSGNDPPAPSPSDADEISYVLSESTVTETARAPAAVAASKKSSGGAMIEGMKVTASFNQFAVHCMLSGRCIATVALEHMKGGLTMYENGAMSAKASMRQLQIFDYTTDPLVKNPYSAILSFVLTPGKPAITVSYDTFNEHRPSPNIGGKTAGSIGSGTSNVAYDSAVSAQAEQLAFVFRNQFVDEMSQYFLNGPLMRALNNQSSPLSDDDLYQTPSLHADPYQFDDRYTAQTPTCMLLHASLKGPTIIVPTSFTSGESLVINVGKELTLSNNIVKDHETESYTDHVQLSIVGLAIALQTGVAINVAEGSHGGIHDVLSLVSSTRSRSLSHGSVKSSDAQPADSSLLADFNLNVTVARNLTPWIGMRPANDISVSSTPVLLTVTSDLLRAIMVIPTGNLAETSQLVTQADNWYAPPTAEVAAPTGRAQPAAWDRSDIIDLRLATNIPEISIEVGMSREEALIDLKLMGMKFDLTKAADMSQEIKLALKNISVLDTSEDKSNYTNIVGRYSDMVGEENDSSQVSVRVETHATGDQVIVADLNDVCIFGVAPVVKRLQDFMAVAFPAVGDKPPPAPAHTPRLAPGEDRDTGSNTDDGDDDNKLVSGKPSSSLTSISVNVKNIVAFVIEDAYSDETRMLDARFNAAVTAEMGVNGTHVNLTATRLSVTMAHSSCVDDGTRMLMLPQLNVEYDAIPRSNKNREDVKLKVYSKPIDAVFSVVFLDLLTELGNQFAPPAPPVEKDVNGKAASTVQVLSSSETRALPVGENPTIPNMKIPDTGTENATSPSLSTTVNKLFGRISSELSVLIEHISLLIADDFGGAPEPVIDLSLSKLKIYAREWDDPEIAQGAVNFILQADHFVRAKSAWAPMIEKWSCGAMLKPNPFTINVEARDVLNVNLTHAVFESLNDMQIALAKIGTPQAKTMDSGRASYRIVNKTGLPVKFWVLSKEGDATDSRGGKELANGAGSPVHIHDEMAALNAYQVANSTRVAVQVGDTNPFTRVTIAQVGTQNFKRKINGHIVQVACEVEALNHVKVLTIRSAYVVKNECGTNLEVSVSLSSGVKETLGIVERNSSMPVPVQWVHGGSLAVRPVTPEGTTVYNMSEYFNVTDTPNSEAAQQSCGYADKKYADRPTWKFVTHHETVVQKQSGYTQSVLYESQEKEPWQLELEGVDWDYTQLITVAPMVIVENLLPVELTILSVPIDKNRKPTVPVDDKVSQGAHMPPGSYVYPDVFDGRTGLALGLAGYHYALYLWTDKDDTHMVFNGDGVGSTLVLSVEHNILHGCTHELKIFASYWLIDKSRLDLKYRQKAFLAKGNQAMASIDSSHDHDTPDGEVEVVGEGGHSTDHDHITPTLLSAPVKKLGLFSSKLEVTIDGKTWSKAFSIDSIGVSGILEFEGGMAGKLFQRLKPTLNDVGVELAAKIGSGHGKYSRTRIITIRPRYLIVNKTGTALRVAQAVGKNSDGDSANNNAAASSSSNQPGICIERHVTDATPFHWDERKGEHQVVFSLDEAKDYTSSGPLRIDQPTITYLRLHSLTKNTGQPYRVLKVTVVVEDSTSFITVENAAVEDQNYRILNKLGIGVSVHQDGGNVYEDVASNSTHLFGWDRPEGPHDIILQFEGTGKTTKVAFDKITKGVKPIDIPGHGTVYYFTHVADTGYRELVLTPDMSHWFGQVLDNMSSLTSASYTEYAINIRVVGIGVSLIDSTPRELLYVHIGGIEAHLNGSPRSDLAEIKVSKFQIDNQILNANFPVLLRHTPDRPFLQATVVKSNRSTAIDYFDYANVLMQTVEVLLDESSILAVASFFGQLPQALGDVNNTVAPVFEYQYTVPAPYDQDKKMYFRHLMINPVELKVSFQKARESLHDDSHQGDDVSVVSSQRKSNKSGGNAKVTLNPLEVFVKVILNTVANIDEAPIELNALIFEHPFGPRSEITGRLITHYRNQALQEFYLVLGSFDMLGNPVGLAHNLGTGVLDFFFEPAKGITLGAKEFGEGLSKGTKSLIKNSVGGVLNSASKITATLGRGLAVLSLDDKYAARRQRKPRNTGEGLKEGAKDMGNGFVEGITGIVKDPVRGAKQGGAVGFAKGMATGVAGVAVKPLAGILGFMSKTAAGIKAGVSDDVPLQRVRLPRYFDENGVLLAYTQKEAFGHNLLRIIDDAAHVSRKNWPDLGHEQYIHHTLLGKYAVVVTATKIITFDLKDETLEWVHSIDDFSEAIFYSTAVCFVMNEPLDSKKKKKKEPEVKVVQSQLGPPAKEEWLQLEAKLNAVGLQTSQGKGTAVKKK